MKAVRLSGAFVVVALASSIVGGCVRDTGPVIEAPPKTEVTTQTLTPLERGKVRRSVLAEVDSFIDAWKASDSKALKKVLPAAVAKKFTRPWETYAQDNLRIRHVHEVTVLDVTEFNDDSTQASVSYAFTDKSYLVDARGKRARDLPPVDSSLTITLEREEGDDSWKIVRMFMKEEGYR